MIMRNIAACPKSFVKRVYDLKGSTFNRKVIKNEEINFEKVLKDQDFENIE